jgi:choline dehydrogenase
MGKVLGGGASINVMAWARGHMQNWDFFAEEAGDPAWNCTCSMSEVADWQAYEAAWQE